MNCLSKSDTQFTVIHSKICNNGWKISPKPSSAAPVPQPQTELPTCRVADLPSCMSHSWACWARCTAARRGGFSVHLPLRRRIRALDCERSCTAGRDRKESKAVLASPIFFLPDLVKCEFLKMFEFAEISFWIFLKIH